MLLHTGEPHNEHEALKELCERTIGSKTPAEWLSRLTQAQTTLLRKIRSILELSHASDAEIFTFLNHVDVEIWTLEQIRRDLVPHWMPTTNKPQAELFRLTRDRVGEASRRRNSFTADDLRNKLTEESGVEFATQPTADDLREQVKACGAGLRQYKHTFGNTGKHLERGVVESVVAWVNESADDGDGVAMLLDQAGVGKTVVARDVLCALEAAGVRCWRSKPTSSRASRPPTSYEPSCGCPTQPRGSSGVSPRPARSCCSSTR